MARASGKRVRKHAVNVSIREDLIEEARIIGTNMSAVLERGLDQEHLEWRRERWRKENRAAIDKWNAWTDENGLPFDDLRPW